MRIALSDLEFEIKGSKAKAILHPLYLHNEENNRVKTLVLFLEKNLGKKKSEIDFDALSGLFPSEKIVKSLLVSSIRFYYFVPKTTEELLGIEKPNQKEKTKSGDITSFMVTVKDNTKILKNLTPAQIREKVFEEVNNLTKGFVETTERKIAIKKIEEEIGLPLNTLDKILYLDLDCEKILKKKEDVEPIQLIKYFNFDTVETILCFSLDLQMKLKKLPGYLAKNLIYISKKNYVFTDITLEEGGYKITIEPPLEIFSDKGGWGKNIANVATYILRCALREKIAFYLTAFVEPRNRAATYTLQSSDLPLLPSFRKSEEEDQFKPEIDSKIENQFQKTWRKFQGWKAIAEPDAIIVGKKMYVPDFLLERGGKRVYLEIVGFYTMKYILKKKRQMQELEKLNVPIIYLIDETLKNDFTELRDIRKVYYAGINVPSSDIIKILEANYSDFDERFPLFIQKIEKISGEIDEMGGLMTINTIQEKLTAYSAEETSKIINSTEVKVILKKQAIVFLPSFGLVKKSIIQEVKDNLTQITTISLLALKINFPEYKEALISICQYLGYKVKWKSIEEIEIVAPKKG